MSIRCKIFFRDIPCQLHDRINIVFVVRTTISSFLESFRIGTTNRNRNVVSCNDIFLLRRKPLNQKFRTHSIIFHYIFGISSQINFGNGNFIYVVRSAKYFQKKY